ncbi:MAG: OmpA family protein [Planctomycetota bacterium]
MLVFLFLLILAFVEFTLVRFNGAIPGIGEPTAQKSQLLEALEGALTEPPREEAAAEDLFSGEARITLRGKPVLVEEAPKGVRVVLWGKDLFESGSVVLHEEGKRLLEEFAALVRPYPNRLEIVAFVGEQEAPAGAFELSWQRARAVTEHLERRGIRPERFLTGAAGPATGRRGYASSRVEILVEVERERR